MRGLLLQTGGFDDFWAEYGTDIKTWGMLAGGILIYALIVNAFYQVMSKRVMFGAKDETGRVRVGGPGRGFLFLIMFPLVSLAFFLLISATLLFLAEDKPPSEIFVVSMAIVAAVRVAAYISEPTSHDVAKMLPLGMLGVFVVTEDTHVGLVAALRNIFQIFDHLTLIAIYFGIVVILEYLLRMAYLIGQASQHRKPARNAKQTNVVHPTQKR